MKVDFEKILKKTKNKQYKIINHLMMNGNKTYVVTIKNKAGVCNPHVYDLLYMGVLERNKDNKRIIQISDKYLKKEGI